jgi:hypothetical protein
MNSADSSQPPVISEHNTTKSPRWLVWILLSAGAVLAVILFAFDPSQTSFYPICVFKKATGYSCPACGCLRASHQLLHGNIGTAFHLNALFIIAMPIGALLAFQNIFHKRIINRPAYIGWTLLVLFVLFGILRNLPPFLAWSGQ